jgi:hypothetical protein
VEHEIYITDKQLCRRWQCSPMKLWRLRGKGILEKPVKIGGAGSVNLNRIAHIRQLEESAEEVAA